MQIFSELTLFEEYKITTNSQLTTKKVIAAANELVDLAAIRWSIIEEGDFSVAVKTAEKNKIFQSIKLLMVDSPFPIGSIVNELRDNPFITTGSKSDIALEFAEYLSSPNVKLKPEMLLNEDLHPYINAKLSENKTNIVNEIKQAEQVAAREIAAIAAKPALAPATRVAVTEQVAADLVGAENAVLSRRITPLATRALATKLMGLTAAGVGSVLMLYESLPVIQAIATDLIEQNLATKENALLQAQKIAEYARGHTNRQNWVYPDEMGIP